MHNHQHEHKLYVLASDVSNKTTKRLWQRSRQKLGVMENGLLNEDKHVNAFLKPHASKRPKVK